MSLFEISGILGGIFAIITAMGGMMKVKIKYHKIAGGATVVFILLHFVLYMIGD